MEGSISLVEQAPITTLENQFANKEKIDSVAGKLEIVDLTPENIIDSAPILLASGWGETPTSHKDTLKTIFAEKRRAISVKFPRQQAETIQFEGFPQVEINKAVALGDALGARGVKEVDVIAHSEGAINAIILAQLKPGLVRNIVLVDPAGLTGEDNRGKLMVRFLSMLAKDSIRNLTDPKKAPNRLRAANESAKYFLSNPRLALQEARAVTQADIHDLLTKLKDSGIGVSIIHGVDDSLFPIDKLLREGRKRGQIDTIGFYSVKGDHREISVHPEKYTRLAVNALEDLAKLPQRRQEGLNPQPAPLLAP